MLYCVSEPQGVVVLLPLHQWPARHGQQALRVFASHVVPPNPPSALQAV
jgi:hypothetical protein